MHFKPVQWYQGKHPCEKPLDLIRHIIEASSRPGDVVLDTFVGSGSTTGEISDRPGMLLCPTIG